MIKLGDDLGRLRDRALKLQKHFADANEDVRQILISADKIEKRAGRIEELDFSKTDAPAEGPRLVATGRAGAVSEEAPGGGVSHFLPRPACGERYEFDRRSNSGDGGTGLTAVCICGERPTHPALSGRAKLVTGPIMNGARENEASPARIC